MPDLAARLTRPEDDLCERKSNTDYRGWIETRVALANSTPIGSVAVLFIGVGDDGTIADNASIPSLMKSYSDGKAERCYPPIDTIQREFIYNGKSCLAVVIPGSEARPQLCWTCIYQRWHADEKGKCRTIRDADF